MRLGAALKYLNQRFTMFDNSDKALLTDIGIEELAHIEMIYQLTKDAEDMAAEQKARAIYENLIDLTDDPDVIGPLLWLRQREIIHYNRFKELFDYYEEMLNNKK